MRDYLPKNEMKLIWKFKMVRNVKYVRCFLNKYFLERKINLSKIGRFGYKFDTLETNWGNLN